jgi:hypothetical protein
MIPQEEKTATADRLTDALTAAAAIMPPDEAQRPARHHLPSKGAVRSGGRGRRRRRST